VLCQNGFLQSNQNMKKQYNTFKEWLDNAIVLMVTFCILGFFVEHIWNYVVPFVFPMIKSINYFQALGLTFLSDMLFKKNY